MFTERIRAYYDTPCSRGHQRIWSRLFETSSAEAHLEAMARIAHKRPRRVLDVGCGVGDSTFTLARRAQEVVGLDIAPHPLLAAMRRAPGKPEGERCRFLLRDIRQYQGAPSYDATVALGVLGHYREPGPLLKRMTALSFDLVLADLPLRGIHGTIRRVAAGHLDCPYHLFERREVEEILALVPEARWETVRTGDAILLVGRKAA